MGESSRPGQGARPGIESQNTATGLGKGAQVPRDPASPNAEPFDRSGDADELRPTVDEGAGDPRAGAGDLGEASSQALDEAAGDRGAGRTGAGRTGAEEDTVEGSNPSPS